MNVTSIEIRNGEVRVEAYVLYCVGSAQSCKPLFDRHSNIRKDVVVYVDLKTKYFAFLQLRLGIRETATDLTIFNAAFLNVYLKGEAWNYEGRRGRTALLSIALLRWERLGLSVIN